MSSKKCNMQNKKLIIKGVVFSLDSIPRCCFDANFTSVRFTQPAPTKLERVEGLRNVWYYKAIIASAGPHTSERILRRNGNCGYFSQWKQDKGSRRRRRQESVKDAQNHQGSDAVPLHHTDRHNSGRISRFRICGGQFLVQNHGKAHWRLQHKPDTRRKDTDGLRHHNYPHTFLLYPYTRRARAQTHSDETQGEARPCRMRYRIGTHRYTQTYNMVPHRID